MALATVGLQTHIWNNQIKSVLLLLGFPLLLLGIMGVYFILNPMYPSPYGSHPLEDAWAGISRYGIFAFAAAGVWFVIAWFSHTAIINAATGAQPIERTDAPDIYNLLENLCISRGMVTPKLQIMDTPALNAFASGINEKNYRITLTRGIIEALDRDELEAVIGHELSHIRHKDVRLLIIAVIFAGIITFVCEMIYRMFAYGGGAGRRRDGRALLVAFALLGVGYVLAIAIRFSLSRSREYLADAGSVELTKNPDALIRALKKISGHAELPAVPDDVRQMMIENKAGFFGLFATHPPIEDRIRALIMMGGREEEQPPERIDRKASAPRPWARRHGPWE